MGGKDLESHLEKSEQETYWQKVNLHRHMYAVTFIFSILRPEHLRVTFASLTHPQESPPRCEVLLPISPPFRYSKSRKGRENPFLEAGYVKTLKMGKGANRPRELTAGGG